MNPAEFFSSLKSRFEIVKRNLEEDKSIKPETRIQAIEQAKEMFEKQCLLDVKYYSFDGKVHQGQIVVHADVVEDMTKIFDTLLKEKFPIQKTIPVSDPKYNWDDEKSMQDNNTSCFNYRPNASDPKKLSEHSKGIAIDINPKLNPYMRQKNAGEEITVKPAGALYDKKKPGTLTKGSRVVKKIKQLGWDWGGEWKVPGVNLINDNQHFEKLPKPEDGPLKKVLKKVFHS